MEAQTQRTDLWTQWVKQRMGSIERIAWKHTYIPIYKTDSPWECVAWCLFNCLFNFHAKYIMRNSGLDEAQNGIKIAGRNVNNLRYADDTILMAEREEELKRLLMKWKWRVKKLLKAQHSEKEDHGIRSQHFMGNRWRNSGNSVRLYFSGLQNHCRWWLQPWN